MTAPSEGTWVGTTSENLKLWQILALEGVGSKWEDPIRAILDSAIGTVKQLKSAIFYWPVDMARMSGSIRESQMDLKHFSRLGRKQCVKEKDHMYAAGGGA